MKDSIQKKTEEWWAVQLLRKTNLKFVYWLSADNNWAVENGYERRFKYQLRASDYSICKFKTKQAAHAALRSKMVKEQAIGRGYVPQIVKITKTTTTEIEHKTEIVRRPKGVSPLVLLAAEAQDDRTD